MRICEFTIPVTKDLIVSEANRSSEHWTKKKKRHDTQKWLVNSYLNTNAPLINFPLPCCVIMTRIAPRFLDEEDNLRMSFKWIKDYIADWIIPGNQSAGMKDSDKRIRWLYIQEKGKPKEYAIKIELRSVQSIFEYLDAIPDKDVLRENWAKDYL